MGRPVREPHPLPVEIVRRTREAVGRDFIIIYRLSMLDLVEAAARGTRSSRSRRRRRGRRPLINTGIGWHEARIRPSTTMVPRGAFAWVTRRLKGAVRVPLVTHQPHQRPGRGRGDPRAR
jgi:2,4-dienoyl-CoA reductase (NADPH2)